MLLQLAFQGIFSPDGALSVLPFCGQSQTALFEFEDRSFTGKKQALAFLMIILSGLNSSEYEPY